MNRLRWFAIVLLAGVLVVSACAPQTVVVMETVEVEMALEREVQVTRVVEVEKEVVRPAEPTMAPPAAGADQTDDAAEDRGTLPMASPRRASRMIIKNAELRLLVEDTRVAIDQVTQVAEDTFGYVLSSRTWYKDDYQYATITLGVPAEEYEGALRRLRGLGLRVLDETASGQDVTDQYVDLQSRLRNLEATEITIRSFLDKATTVEESLQVNRQLSEITDQIEEIKGKMNYLKDRSSYSTITVHLEPQLPTPTPTPTPTATATPTPTPTPTPLSWQPDKTFSQASKVMVRMWRGIGNTLIWIVVVLGPFLIPVALVVWLAIWFRRRSRPAGKKAETESAPVAEGDGEG